MANNKDFLEAEVRQKIIDALKTDLVGPQTPNEVLDENPMFEYLTGMLYPKSMENCELLEQEVDEDVDRMNEDTDYTPRPDEDDNEPMVAAKFTQQSSIGLSFYVKKSTQKFIVDVSWGDYIRSSEKIVNEKGNEVTKYYYTRQQADSGVEIVLSDFSKSNDYALPEDSNLQLHVVKIGLGNDYQLVTVHLTNRRPMQSPELYSIIFQAEISVHSEDNSPIFIAENICREILSEDEFYFAERPIFARGRGCAAMWESNDVATASRIYTSFIPEYEFPGVKATIEGFDEHFFLMSFFAKPSHKTETIARLTKLCNSYAQWIDEKLIHDSKMQDADFKTRIGDNVIAKCQESLRRMQDGLSLIATDDKVFEAFCFMNSVMTLQRSISNYSKKHGKGITCNFGDFVNPNNDKNKFCWRPFQIAFILMNLKGIVDPTSADRNIVDLLYFPTGGGKTEAYLGLIAFVIALRRLNSNIDDGYERDGGTAAILRYTLRLLTAQQRDRLTKMIIAAEMERRRQPLKYGKTPITIGFWVGGGVTPNDFKSLEEDPKEPEKAKDNKRLLYKQLLRCPFCGKELSEENYHIDYDAKTVRIYCDDRDCIFYKYGNSKMGINVPMPLPVALIDEEIYRRCPTVILATVDKFAALPWRVDINSLFGRVSHKCTRCGYIAIGEKHPKHRETEELAASKLNPVKPFAPPELIVQDELHLITGPLGTIYGGYETIIQKLCSYKIGNKTILPKYVVSTATIKNASDQVRCLYGRKDTMQFPANGFEIGDSFFIKEISTSEHPFRKYVGISASGQSMKTTTLRVYAIILQTVHELAKIPAYREHLDPYYTLIGYFNSIRELGGTVRLLQDDIPKRINRIKKKYNYSSPRYLNESSRVEITSRISSSKISEFLQKLEAPMSDTGKCLDVAIATNMISVGMDVDRLGLMTVMGQPKQNSEYIQATSRIGRAHPGVVFTIYNPYRPRDLSHYENFVGYHEQLYRYVEGTTATPFAARARDRVLHALIISAIRLLYPKFADNMAANDISMLTEEQKNEVVSTILDRLSIVNPQARADTARDIELFIGDWRRTAAQSKILTYNVGNSHLDKYNRLMNDYSDTSSDKEKGTLRSMREVEASAKMYYFSED